MSTHMNDVRFSIHYDDQDPKNEGWAYSFAGWTEDGQHRTASGEIENTRDLLCVLQTYAPADYDGLDDLPTFGGETPECTLGVFSWDETHLLIGPDLQRVPRHDDSTGGEQ